VNLYVICSCGSHLNRGQTWELVNDTVKMITDWGIFKRPLAGFESGGLVCQSLHEDAQPLQSVREGDIRDAMARKRRRRPGSQLIVVARRIATTRDRPIASM